MKNPHSAEQGFLVLEGAVAHTARGRDGRQEGRERGYYHLHRNLNETLLHDLILFTLHSSLFTLHSRSASLCRGLRR